MTVGRTGLGWALGAGLGLRKSKSCRGREAGHGWTLRGCPVSGYLSRYCPAARPDANSRCAPTAIYPPLVSSRACEL